MSLDNFFEVTVSNVFNIFGGRPSGMKHGYRGDTLGDTSEWSLWI